MKRAVAIHYTTDDEKNKIADFTNLDSKSLVIPCGIDLTQYNQLPKPGDFKIKYPILEDKKYILFLGRINAKKGLDLLIESFSKLALDDNKLFLVIAGGDDGYRNTIENRIRELNLLQRVLFTGMLSGNDKLAAYVDAEAFVLSSYSENFGMAVVEAMACGTPVVISNKVGIYKDIQEAKGGLVCNLAVNDFYIAIKKLLYNPNLCSEFSTNAKKIVKEKYDISRVADSMIKAYKKVINNAALL